jgi:hypothetical protein
VPVTITTTTVVVPPTSQAIITGQTAPASIPSSAASVPSVPVAEVVPVSP